ncbi:hypothetical protein [Marinobacter metalliresistant]|uniref:Uncharacterized protein n=1 Tax=Marinobacter metalliresistant TaxID=2961995 RepID=A0ABZ2W2V7_9GAMM|tara:strand:+ start:491 stop:757 length:267 start_codon:yes stop_codon:yes gene_type:complete
MNPDLLALTLLNDQNFTLSEISHEDSDMESNRERRFSFEMLSNDGEIVGYIKTWHHEDGYAGFVHFDAEGNIIDWKAFAQAPGSIQSH